MTDSAIKFRTQLSGYNKEDVNNYIKELDRRYFEENEKLKSELNSSNAGLNECRAQLEEQSSRLAQAIEEAKIQADTLEKIGKNLAEESAQREILMTRNVELEKSSAEKESEIELLKSKIAEMTALLEEKNADAIKRDETIRTLRETNPLGDVNDKTSIAYKLEMYNKISSELGDLMINANRSADQIVSQAKDEAEKLLKKTKDECAMNLCQSKVEAERIRSEVRAEVNAVREKITSVSSEMLSSVSAELHSNLENCVGELEEYLSGMQYEIRAMIGRFDGRRDEINTRISFYQSSAADGIGKKLDELDKKCGLVKSKELDVKHNA